ncbi:MAG: M48 family metalloprotease [Myxococcales bacterium]|nr:M48 family metalloprotease [Myxococcales bacterium]
MEDLHIPAPDVPTDLTDPGGRYRLMVLVVLGALGLFVAFYLALIGLSVDQLRLSATLDPREHFVVVWVGGLVAVSLLFLLISGLLGVERGGSDGVLLDPAEQPRLVAFVHGIADAVGAPRPRKIFLTPDVNAAVTYDSSALNLLLPTQKNLIIGLGLVNALTLDELKAVLAHEFGHFSQSSMRLGSYVYVANGVIARIVGHRGWLDTGVSALSRFDLRIAWVGWILGALIWAVRSVLETLFLVMALPARALTRQMEFHADKVAVSVTGSDSLIHALHKLGFAERALREATGEVAERLRNGRVAVDLFAHQTAAMENLRRRDMDPTLGTVPAVPASGSSHRIFDEDDVAPLLAMWSTHPSHEAREASAKTPYFPSHFDSRPGWVIFDDPDRARRAVTASFLTTHFDVPPDALADEDTTAGAGVLALEPRYLGLYTVTNIAATVEDPDDLLPDGDPDGPFYDDELAVRLKERARAMTDLHRLLGFCMGDAHLPPEGVRFHGQQLDGDAVLREAAALRDQLVVMDGVLHADALALRGRVHARAARRGEGWAQAHGDAVAWLHCVTHVGLELAAIDLGLQNVLAFLQEHEINEAEERDIADELSSLRLSLVDLAERVADAEVPDDALPPGRTPSSALFPGRLPDDPPITGLSVPWMKGLHHALHTARVGHGDLVRSAMDHVLRIEADVIDDPYGPDIDPEPLELPAYPLHPGKPWLSLAGLQIPHPSVHQGAGIGWRPWATAAAGLAVIGGMLWARWSLS